jgi:hypothetical protein
VNECKEHRYRVEGETTDTGCPYCEIDRLKAGLKRSELSRATLSGLYHDLQCQLAEVKHELETTQLHLMEEETTRKIWEQDCKKAESQLAELQQLQVEIVESAGSTQQHLLAQLSEARAEVERFMRRDCRCDQEGGGGMTIEEIRGWREQGIARADYNKGVLFEIIDTLLVEVERITELEQQLQRTQTGQINQEERRFTAAVAVLQGLVTGKQTMPVLDEDIAAEQAIQAYYAVMQADALLKELAK